MSVALSVLFMSLGAFIEMLDLTSAALSSIVMLFVFIEIGSPYTFLVWLSSSLLGAVLFPHSFVWVSYLFVFGIYPIIKAYIERAPRQLWILIRLVYFAISGAVMILASELVFGIPFFTEDMNIPLLGDNTALIKIIILAALLVAMFLYDIFLTAMVRFYFDLLRPRIQRILK